jgi:hypothetical protein
VKPFYFKNGDLEYVAIVYKSVHEDDDYLVVLRQEKYKNHYIRVCKNSPEEAASFAFEKQIELDGI